MKSDLSVTILGFTVTDQTLRDSGVDPRISPQTRNFAFAFQDSLSKAGCRVTLLSALPVLDYPKTRLIFARSGELNVESSEGRLLGFINLTGLKHVTRALACLVSGLRFLRRMKTDVLIVHGVHSPFLWFSLVAKRLLGVTVVPILTDPPGVILADDGWLRTRLKLVDAWIIRSLLSGADASISLTAELGATLTPAKPNLVMEGILNPALVDRVPKPSADDRPFTITYAGGLVKEYGVDRLVEAFQLLHRADTHLIVCGSGNLEGWLLDKAEGNPNIEFLGMLSSEKVLEVFDRSTVLVNPRPAQQELVKYSFPSKLIEYMAVGRPVLSTDLACIPADYRDLIWISAEDDPHGLAEALASMIETPRHIRHERSEAAREFVVKYKSPLPQGARMKDFLLSIDQHRFRRSDNESPVG